MSTTIDLDTLHLDAGGHDSFEDGACLLEAASYVAGEPWSDHPQCVSPVLAAFGRRLNDMLPNDERQQLRKFIRDLLNTAGDGLDERRRWMLTDWAVRVATPRILDVVGLSERAAQLRALEPVTNAETAERARDAARLARDEAWIARRRATDDLKTRIQTEMKKLGITAVADAVADAAADAVADAAADAAAVAAADAAADDAAAAAAGETTWWKVYRAVRAKLKATTVDQWAPKYAEANRVNRRGAIDLLGRMITGKPVA